jgi:hypothetical protein
MELHHQPDQRAQLSVFFISKPLARRGPARTRRCCPPASRMDDSPIPAADTNQADAVRANDSRDRLPRQRSGAAAQDPGPRPIRDCGQAAQARSGADDPATGPRRPVPAMTPPSPADPADRVCAWCSGPIPATRRSIAVYCSPRCLRASYRNASAERARQERAILRLEFANPACGRPFTPSRSAGHPSTARPPAVTRPATGTGPASAETKRKLAINCYLAVITVSWPRPRTAVASITVLARAVQAAIPAGFAEFEAALSLFCATADQITRLATACHDASTELAGLSREPSHGKSRPGGHAGYLTGPSEVTQRTLAGQRQGNHRYIQPASALPGRNGDGAHVGPSPTGGCRAPRKMNAIRSSCASVSGGRPSTTSLT